MNPKTETPEEVPMIDLGGYTEQGLLDMEIGLAGRASELLMVASEFAISDQETLAQAIDVTSQIKAVYNQIEADRDEYTRPMLLLKRLADGKFKAVTDPLKAEEARVKTMILNFQRAEQKKIDEALMVQKVAELEAQKEHERKLQEAAKANEPAPEPPPPPPPPPPSVAPAYGNYGAKATQKSKWVHEVKDVSDVPLKFLQVDDKAVKAAIRDGVRDIPGIRIFDEGTVAFT